MNIFVLNCWNRSLAFHLVSLNGRKVLAAGTVDRISVGGGTITVKVAGRTEYRNKAGYLSHKSAIRTVMQLLSDHAHHWFEAPPAIDAIAHRVVHGGEKFSRCTFVDQSLLASLRALAELAPLHLPHNIAGIEAAMQLMPHVPQTAVFDTAFHQTMPEKAYLYPLPYPWYEKKGIRRYGFHGHAHLHALQRGSAIMSVPPEHCTLISIAVGRGISVCAIKNGISADTSMGLTPLEGVVMDTRCGDIDPGIPAFMMQRLNLSPLELYRALNEKSGLLGIAGSGSRRELKVRAGQGDRRAAVALALQEYRLKKQIGAYVAGIGKPDAVVFVANEEGDDWYLREHALEGLECMGIRLDRISNRCIAPGSEGVISTTESPIKVLSIAAQIEMVICEEVEALLKTTPLEGRASYPTASGSNATAKEPTPTVRAGSVRSRTDTLF